MGKIELDHTGSGGGVTLSSDGTDLLLDGTAIGGGGGTALELYAENPSSPTAPSATGTNAVAIGSGASAGGTHSFVAGHFATDNSNRDAVVIGRFASASAIETVAIGEQADANGTRSVAIGYLADANGSNSIAIGNNPNAASQFSISIGADTQANFDYSTAMGYGSGGSKPARAQGLGAMALGGSYASGTDSFAAAIANNTSSYGATGANSVAMGAFAKSTGQDAISIGDASSATANWSVAIGRSTCSGGSAVCIGDLNVVSGGYGTALGGRQNEVTVSYAVATGYKALASQTGKVAHSAGPFSTLGDAQTGTFVLRSDTTDATPEALTTTNSTAGTTNQIILPNNSAYAFHGTIVARQQASQGTACAAWKIEGLIRREGSAGTTVLVNSATTVLDNTPSWGMALSADTTNGGLKIEVTGAAATNIRWVATINTSEVTY